VATLVGALRAVHASFREGQRRFAKRLLKVVKGKVKKKRSPSPITDPVGKEKRADPATTTEGCGCLR